MTFASQKKYSDPVLLQQCENNTYYVGFILSTVS